MTTFTADSLALALRDNPDLLRANADATLTNPPVRRTPENAQPGTWSRPQSFFVPGTLPGLNEIISAAKVGGRGKAYSDMKRKSGQMVKDVIQWASLKPAGRVSITCTWQEPSRRRDPDNIFAGVKFILDALVDSGILAGDGWQQVADIRHKLVLDKDHPGVWVEIVEAQP